MKDRFNLTKKQFEKLLNQHIGTGVICYRINDSTVCTTEFCFGRDNKLHTLTGHVINLEEAIKAVVDEEELSA